MNDGFLTEEVILEDNIDILDEDLIGNIFDRNKEEFSNNNFKKIINESIINGTMSSSKFSPEQYRKMFIKQTKSEVKNALNGNIKYFKDPSSLLTDYGKNKNKIDKNKNFNIKGVYFKFIKPDDIVKLEIDGTCIGYIYIEKSQLDNNNALGSSMMNGGTGGILKAMTSTMSGDNSNPSSNNTSGITDVGVQQSPSDAGDTALQYQGIVDMFIKSVSKRINKEFIEDNPEFKDTIIRLIRQDYIIDKQISITYIPPEEITHIKLDSNNTYGVSRLYKSLFAAKMYLSTQITNAMVKINQGRDRRVFYVDSDMDNDFESVVQDVIREIRSKETGKSVKHWCVTEKGHTNTRRIHLHGLFYAREGQTKWQLTKLLYAQSFISHLFSILSYSLLYHNNNTLSSN